MAKIQTARGPVHIFKPNGRGSHAVAIYVHGYHDTADSAVANHRLEQQFARSGRDATFLVPEAPSASGDPVRFPDLSELLKLAGVSDATPVVAIAHSGGYRTVLPWLDNPRLKHLILLDAVYGGADAFRAWGARADHTMQVVGYDTADASKALATATRAPYRQATGHMAIVTDGQIIPETLRASPLGGGGSPLFLIALAGFVAWGAWRLLR